MRIAECGMRNAECGMRNAECGMRNADLRFLQGSPCPFFNPFLRIWICLGSGAWDLGFPRCLCGISGIGTAKFIRLANAGRSFTMSASFMAESSDITDMKEFRLHEKDTGSADVQVALLTRRISQLTEHLKSHAKDHSSRRGLLKMVAMRRSLLDYLSKSESERYKKLLEKLNLRK